MNNIIVKFSFVFLYIFNTILLITLVSTDLLIGALFILCNLFATIIIHYYFRGFSNLTTDELNEEITRYNELFDKNEDLELKNKDLHTQLESLEYSIQTQKDAYKKIVDSIKNIEKELDSKNNETNNLSLKLENYNEKHQEHQDLIKQLALLEQEIEKSEAIISDNKSLNSIYEKQINRSNKIILKQEMKKIDSMDGFEFENYLVEIFENNGFEKTIVTVSTGDQGVDLKSKKNNMTYAIQAKRYSNPVGNKAVQEIIAGKVYYNLDEAIVITTNYFTPSARDLAIKSKVILIDRLGLKEMILNTIKNNPDFGLEASENRTRTIIEINRN
jgi:HJR/Mrr/RecB family endonuclease